ncbi:carbohydrate ABC transporter permease [Paenibacillus faecalis]|uniref:carbohydrate ABC transporter permease n=1 Tax=Paenibacillus faecalis TaxID=2079532 RepID=UPI001F21D313|nr:carbohydrate ABC transporter permease [Paenibacillus faecalis]
MRKFTSFNFGIHVVLMAVAICMIVPFYSVVISSFASVEAIGKQGVYLIPTSFDLSSYKYIFSGLQVWKSLGVSVFVTIVGTATSMLFTVCGAYAVSKKKMPGSKIILTCIVFTMLFSGGLVPFYLTVKNLHLLNNLASLILPTAVNTFYFIIMLSYFRTVPEALEESAKIDGANDLQILYKIIIPTSVPTMIAITLFYAVDRWNDWWSAMIFIRDTSKFPMQLYLREMLIDVNKMISGNVGSSFVDQARDTFPLGIQMAAVMITTLPIIFVYPWLQKYFANGVMLGAIKE